MAALCSVVALSAQTVETDPYLVFMYPANETPPIAGNTSTAIGTVLLHVVRDNSGTVTSATAELDISYKLDIATNITGFHIHTGAAGVSGGVVIDSGISSASPVVASSTTGNISRNVPITSSTTAAFAAVNGILQNPANYYLNIHTTEFPGGLMRGQLMPATPLELLTSMQPQNENPPVTDSTGTALTSIYALAARDSSGNYLGGQVTFDVNYTGFTPGLNLTGLHIHKGPVGVNAGIVIPTTVSAANPVTVPASGSGNIHTTVDVYPVSGTSTVMRDLYTQPTGHYANVHTTSDPGGAARGQLAVADKTVFQVTLSTANEVPPVTNVTASAPAEAIIYTTRNADGTVALAAVAYDVDYQITAPLTFTGLHIHRGAAGTNGGVVLDSGLSSTNSVSAPTNTGNVYRMFTVTTTAGLSAVNDLLVNPENFYLNIHTTDNPGGLMRSQLTAVNTAMPTVTSVSSAASPTVTTIAPGELITIRGANLTKVQGDSSGAGGNAPTSLNGTSVMIGGKAAAILSEGPGFIVTEVPTDLSAPAATPGASLVTMTPVSITTANGTSAGQFIALAATAPAIFADANNAAIAEKNSDYSLITTINGIQGGDILDLYGTGFGVTTPAVATGLAAPSAAPFAATQTVTVTIGGQPATVIYSILSPGFVGLNQLAVRVPTGLTPGAQPVVVTIGGVSSTPVTVTVAPSVLAL